LKHFGIILVSGVVWFVVDYPYTIKSLPILILTPGISHSTPQTYTRRARTSCSRRIKICMHW